MSEITAERAAELEEMSAPFFAALGMAFTRWQHVEAALFVIAHAIMGADYRYSSIVFFHIRSADSKAQLVDRLCHEYFDAEFLATQWKDLLTDINAGIALRNTMAHFEANWVVEPSVLEPGEPPRILTPHHLDPRMAKKEKVGGLTTRGLQRAAEGYMELARALFALIHRQFPIERLRATNLPPRLLQLLETAPPDPPAAPQPPRSSPPEKQNRRARRKAARGQKHQK